MTKKIDLSHLSPESVNVTQHKTTETPFTGKYYHFDEPGQYECIVCHHPLFSSDTKYDSGSGWPSFYNELDQAHIKVVQDTSHGMIRNEIVCGNCGAHLGHIFDDGPMPNKKRYCVNSASLHFEKQEDESTKN